MGNSFVVYYLGPPPPLHPTPQPPNHFNNRMVRKGGGDLVSGGWRVAWPGANWRIGLYSVRSCLIDNRMVFFDHTLPVHKFGTEVCICTYVRSNLRKSFVCVWCISTEYVLYMYNTCIIHTVYLEELVGGERERERDRKPDEMIWYDRYHPMYSVLWSFCFKTPPRRIIRSVGGIL